MFPFPAPKLPTTHHTHLYTHVMDTSSSLGDSLFLDDVKTDFNLLLLKRNGLALVLISAWLKI